MSLSNYDVKAGRDNDSVRGTYYAQNELGDRTEEHAYDETKQPGSSTLARSAATLDGATEALKDRIAEADLTSDDDLLAVHDAIVADERAFEDAEAAAVAQDRR